VYGDSHGFLELPCPVMFTEREGTFTLSRDQRAGVAGSQETPRLLLVRVTGTAVLSSNYSELWCIRRVKGLSPSRDRGPRFAALKKLPRKLLIPGSTDVEFHPALSV